MEAVPNFKVSRSFYLEVEVLKLIASRARRDEVSDSEAARSLVQAGHSVVSSPRHDRKACPICSAVLGGAKGVRRA